MNKRWTGGQRAFRIFILFGGLAVTLGAAHASASSLRVIGAATGISVDPVAVRVVSDEDRRAHRRGAYDPAKIYSGVYTSEQLYRRVLGSDRWAGSRRPARIREATCRDARNALERSGAWTGQLNANGACGSGEPTEWATGNFLNYQAGLDETDGAL